MCTTAVFMQIGCETVCYLARSKTTTAFRDGPTAAFRRMKTSRARRALISPALIFRASDCTVSKTTASSPISIPVRSIKVRYLDSQSNNAGAARYCISAFARSVADPRVVFVA